MRRLFFLLLTGGMLMAGHSVKAQIGSLPSQVTDSLKARYPNASKVSWKDRIGYAQANFMIDTSKYEARFRKNGTWVSTEKTIGQAALPAPVNDGLRKSKYADWKIKTVYQVYLPGSVIQYHILVSKSDLQKRNLLFSPEGQLLKDNITL
ncbi:MAG: PepSY-like domain-containing protein [Puia sp.]|nr:PepSY-like domain-containing protein [Puia sp.]